MSLRVRVGVALVCAVLAAVLMGWFAADVRKEAAEQRAGALERYGGEVARVCVATKDIARGEVFSERNVATAEWLVDLLPQGAVADLPGLMGQTAASAIAQNTPVAAICVSSQEDPLDVPAGAVAVSVPCTNETAVGGSLAAGSVVDVYVLSDGAARLLCQEVQVLQTNAAGTSASLAWATLAVEPSEVEAVIAASGLQRLYFVLPSEEEVRRRAVEQAAPPAAAGAPVEAPAGEGGAGAVEGA